MKRILYYFFVSMVFAVLFTAVDIVNKQVMLNPDNDVFNNLMNGNIKFSNFGFENFNFGNFNLGKFDILKMGQSEKATGECGDDKPLLLTNGDCVACDYGAKHNVDILMGCERCSNKTKLNCLFKIDVDNVVKHEIKDTEIKQIKKTLSPHRYKLIKIVGYDEIMRAVVVDNFTHQKKIIAVGDTLNGATVKSISAFDGIIVEKNGMIEKLDIGR